MKRFWRFFLADQDEKAKGEISPNFSPFRSEGARGNASRPLRTKMFARRVEKNISRQSFSFECEFVEWSRETLNARRIYRIMFSYLWYINQTSQHVDNIWIVYGMIINIILSGDKGRSYQIMKKKMLKWSCYRKGPRREEKKSFPPVFAELFQFFASAKVEEPINQIEWII